MWSVNDYRKILLVDCDKDNDLFLSNKLSGRTLALSFERLSMDEDLPIIFAKNFCVCE